MHFLALPALAKTRVGSQRRTMYLVPDHAELASAHEMPLMTTPRPAPPARHGCSKVRRRATARREPQPDRRRTLRPRAGLRRQIGGRPPCRLRRGTRRPPRSGPAPRTAPPPPPPPPPHPSKPPPA